MQIKLCGIVYSDCHIMWREYQNKRPALFIKDGYGVPLATASVNLPDVDLPEKHILIKNYAENAGLLQSLIDNKILKDTGKTIATGFVEVNLCKIL